MMLAAASKALAGVPPSVRVTLASLAAVSALAGMSAARIVSHAGAAPAAPVPVIRANFRVVVMLAASSA